MIDLVNVLYGKNEYLVQEKLNEKIKETNVDEININIYDLQETKSEDIIEDLRTVSFFSERKVIVVKNIKELLNEDDTVINDWIKYLDKPNPDVYLFIILDGELVSENYSLGKAIFKIAYIEEIGELKKDEYPFYIESLLKKKGFEITAKASKELISRTNYDLNLVAQELEKLMLYNFDTKIIDIDSVSELVSRNLEENIYELTNNLLNNNSSKTIEIYYDLLARSEDPLRIMNSIVNKIRDLIHTKLLIAKGYSQEDIEKHFNIKSGVAYYLVKNANQLPSELLEGYLERLSKLDFDIKTGKLDKKIGLEIFILGA
ncbi:DNA polymerase III subunit delta [Haploplasma axanthum]|uniref:DNA polymerase III subunit delta n=1 Tax=Haploplasma axanthum TaxID=29552 RepID=A0A449BE12_HAPAX|nr:DNA polymerase III subunit delta [Haploplasma axanthum]VEU80676.1 DNA-directed DNA polymerase [Haploplasma axanthum]